MSGFKNRFERKLNMHGSTLHLNGVTPFKAIVQELTGAQMTIYLDSSEVSQMQKPGLYLVCGADTLVAEGDTLTHNSRVFSVQRVFKQQLGSQAVLQTVILL